MRENQRLEGRVGNFNQLASSEYISNTFAQKKYLGWKDKDILANREFLRKDAELQWEIAQITNSGPNWMENVVVDGAGEAGGDATGLGAPPSGGGGDIPSFGGGPATTDTGGAEPPPAGGEEASTPPAPAA